MPTRQEIDAHLGDVLSRYPNVPADVARSLMGVESGGNPDAVSHKGAYGLMQLMPATARELGVDPRDWRQNVEGGIRYLSQNLDRFGGDLTKAVAAYHAGPGAVERAGGIPNTNDGLSSTERYVSKVLGLAGQMRAAQPQRTLPAWSRPESEWRKAGDWASDFGAQRALPPVAPVEKPGLWEDTKNALYSGVLALGEDVRELTRLALGDSVVAKIDGLDRAITGATLDERRAATEAAYSPEMAEALRKQWWDDEKGTLGPAATDWRSWYGGLMQSIPGTAATMLPAFGMARALEKGVKAGALAAGAGEKAAQAYAAKLGARTATIAGAILEGTQGGAQAARGVRDEILALPDSVLDQSEAFRALVAEHGGDRAAARRSLAGDRAALAFLGAGVVTGVFGGAGDRMLFKLWSGAEGGPLLKRLAIGAVTEGALEEFPQSYGSRVAENVAMQAADSSRRTLEGAMGEGIGGLAVGALMGGGMGAAIGRNRQLPPPPARETPPGVGRPLDDSFVSGSVAEGEGVQGGGEPPPAPAAPVPPAAPLPPDLEQRMGRAGQIPPTPEPARPPTAEAPPEISDEEVLRRMRHAELGVQQGDTLHPKSGEPFKDPRQAGQARARMGAKETLDIVQLGQQAYVLRPKAPAAPATAEQPATEATNAIPEQATIGNAPSQQDQLQAGPSTEPGVDRKAAVDIARHGAAAISGRIPPDAGSDRAQSGNIAPQPSTAGVGGKEPGQVVPNGDVGAGASVRAPNGDGNDAGSTVTSVGARSPQERERLGQSPTEPRADVAQGARDTPRKGTSEQWDAAIARVEAVAGREVGDAFRRLRELRDDAEIARRARPLYELLAQAPAGSEKASAIQGGLEAAGLSVPPPAPSAEGQQQPAAAPPAQKQAGQMPGATPKETEQIGEAFDDAQKAATADDQAVHHLFDEPAKSDVVRLADKVKVYNAQHGWMTPAEAKAKINEWKKHAARQGDTNRNADKVVLSLFDLTGAWSQPWEDAGYNVFRFDIQADPEGGDVTKFSTEFFNDWWGDFDGQDIYAILAACPCTDFASSGARHFAAKDADGRTRSSVELVQHTLATIEHFKPAIWAIENPVGRIESLTGLPPWRLSFDPNHFGDPYTKKTLLWGRFNADLPIAPVEPTEGSKMHQKYGGKSQATKNARSVTPEGFAYSFFMANNAADHQLMAVSNKYDRLDKGAIKSALDAGLTEKDIDSLVEDFYYQDLDDEAANKALRDAAAKNKPMTQEPKAEAIKPEENWQPLTASGPMSMGAATALLENNPQRRVREQAYKVEGQFVRRDGDRAVVKFNDGTRLVLDPRRLEWIVGESPAAEPQTTAVPTPAYGAKNTVFTADAAAKARELLKAKLGQANAGLDPEIVQAGITLAGYHIEAGARTFAAYTKAMVDDLGETVRPYLRSWYEAVRHYPGFDSAGMTPPEQITVEAREEVAPGEPTPPPDQPEPVKPAYEVDAEGNRVWKQGERVVITGPDTSEVKGRHGAISEVTAMRWSAVFGSNESGLTYHYRVRTDAGTEEYASPRDLAPETGEAPKITPDVNDSNHYYTPEAYRRHIQSARESVRNFQGKLARAKKPEVKREYQREIERWKKEGDRRQDVYDSWARANNIQAPAPKESPASASGPAETSSMMLVDSKDKYGKDVYIVVLKNRVSRDEFDRLRGLATEKSGYWYGKSRTPGFNFRKREDAQAFMGVPPAAIVPTAPPLTRQDVVDRILAALAANERVRAWISNAGNRPEDVQYSIKEPAEQALVDWATADKFEHAAIYEELIKDIARNEYRTELVRTLRGMVDAPNVDQTPLSAPLEAPTLPEQEATNGPDSQPAASRQDGQTGDEGPRPADVQGAEQQGDARQGGERPSGAIRGADDGRLQQGADAVDGGRKADRTGGAGAQPGRGSEDGGRAGVGTSARVPSQQQPDRPERVVDYHPAVGEIERRGSWLQQARTNLDIIALVKQLDAEQRQATPAEQALLAKWTGWGASELASNVFKGYRRSDGRFQFDTYSGDQAWIDLRKRMSEELTDDEIDAASRSTQYAHFTSETIIRGMWSAMERLGFSGGRIFEPGMGTGLFPVMAPSGLLKDNAYTGIEYENFTAKIAKHLLPRQNVTRGDYSLIRVPDGFFDLAIGNPPFARTQVLVDPDYKRFRFSLHDFFFAKTIDRVRPGGIMAFVTSRYSMDKADDKARQYLSERADLLGAIRLPRTAFAKNAGTEVVTDILIFQRRAPGTPYAGQPFLNRVEAKGADGAVLMDDDKPVLINEYFAKHPEMVLGQHSMAGKMRYKNEYTVLPADGELADHLAKAIESLPKDVYTKAAPVARKEREAFERDMSPKATKEGQLYVGDDGEIYRREYGTGVRLEEFRKRGASEKAWFKDYVGLRDLLKQARYDQLTDGAWEKSLEALRKGYKSFVRKHGPLLTYTESERVEKDDDGEERTIVERRYKNEARFKADVEGPLVAALELIDSDGNIQEGPFLKSRVLAKPEPPKVDTVQDALLVSLSDRGRLDIPHIAGMLNKSADDVIAELGDAIYLEPGGEWQTADEYLSGDVVDKLEKARIAADADPAYERNVQALLKAQPDPLGATEITVGLGAPWIPVEYVNAFASEVIGLDKPDITLNEMTGTWVGLEGKGSQGGRGSGKEWATVARSPMELLDAALNGRTIKVTYTVKEGDSTKTYTDAEKSAEANDKVRKMREAFGRWVWKDNQRTATLLELYNRKFNNIAPRHFDGSHLRLPGMSLRYKLYDHQKRAIWRIIQTGNTYLAHAVGAGKTLEMIVSAMEQRRLGLVRMPMFVVPNHMLQQFAAEFIDAYPAADIMVADETNFDKNNRRRFVAQAAMNKPDAVIITHSAFGKIRPDPEAAQAVLNRMKAEFEAAIADADDKSASGKRTRKELEQRLEQMEQRFGAKTAGGDDVLTLSEMGVDMLYVDEAHEFRKLDFITNHANVKGITPAGSRRALDLYIKIKALDSARPGRSIVMASGTPVTNTAGELYSLQRFMNEAALEADGLRAFDSWVSQFAAVEAYDERNAAGQYEVVERLGTLVNVPELMSRVRHFMDVLTMTQLKHLIRVPEMRTGGPQILLAEANADLKSYMQELLQRIKASRAWKPTKDEQFNPDPLINIITDARIASIDVRFAVRGARNDPKNKLNLMIDKIIEVHKANADNVYRDKVTDKPEPIKGATQIVFSSVGFGEEVAKNRGFNIRGWIEKRLNEGGIRTEQIAWMNDYDTHAKKEAMFRAMREGRIKVLFGSPKNMGTGVNVQRRLVAQHYLSAPWYPADEEQPRGRIVRQGNQNDMVDVFWYATKETYDSTQWQMIARKSRMIEKALSGGKDLRKIEDVSDASEYEKASALASGDERVIRYTRLRRDIESLELLNRAHADEQFRLEGEIRWAKQGIAAAKERIALWDRAIAAGGGQYIGAYNMEATIKGESVDKPKALGEAVFREVQRILAVSPPKSTKSPVRFELGVSNGHKLIGEMKVYGNGKEPKKLEYEAELHLRFGDVDGQKTVVVVPTDDYSDQGLTAIGTGINNLHQEPADEKSSAEETIDRYKKELAEKQPKIGTPFDRMQELVDKIAEAARLRDELLATGKTDIQEAEALSEAVERERWESEGGRSAFETDDGVRFAAQEPAPRGWGAIEAGGGSTPPDAPGKEATDANRKADAEALRAALERALKKRDPAARVPVESVKAVVVPHDDLVQRIAGAFGKRVAFFTTSQELSFFGGASGIQPGVVYIRSDTARPHLSILGHELLHELRKSAPELYEQFRDAIKPLLTAGWRRHGQDAQAWAAHSEEKFLEELLADLVGDGFMRRAFWKRLGEKDPTLLQRIYNAVLVLIDKVFRAVGGYTPRAREYLKDFEKAIGIAAEVMAEYGKTAARPDLSGPAFASTAGPLWRSALTEAIGRAPYGKDGTIATDQLTRWLQARQKEGAFKADELEWSGLPEWLATRQRVSRDAVAEFLGQNGVRVTEKMLGDNEQELIDRQGAIDGLREEGIDNPTEDQIQEWLRDFWQDLANVGGRDEEAGMTKFASYQLPGGKNYRELLLTLPQPGTEFQKGWLVIAPDGIEKHWFAEEAAARHFAKAQGGWAVWEASEKENRRSSKGFHSSHYYEPNILAHIRFNERTSADGKRVLFIEEIQSDWAQVGRKEGFGDKLKTGWRIVEQEPGFFHLMQEGHTMPRAHGTRDDVLSAANRLDATMKGVPSAPFVGKTDAWVALALKRMIRFAVDGGFDSVAWTTGEQQVKRYEDALRKVADRIEWTKEPGGVRLVAKKNGHIVSDTREREDAISDSIGKAMAERIRKDPNRKGVIEGDNITIDDPGMTRFYGGPDAKTAEGDPSIVANVANQVLRKLGGGKVGTVDIRTVTDRVDGLSDFERERMRQLQERDPDSLSIHAFEELDQLIAKQAATERRNENKQQQPGFTLSPAMKAKAQEGMPLFASQAQTESAARNDDIRFAAQLPQDSVDYPFVEGAKARIASSVQSFLNTSRTFNILHRTVGTQYHKARVDSDFRKVFDESQEYLFDVNLFAMDAQALAPAILPRLDSPMDVLREVAAYAKAPKQAKADMEAVAKLTFEATLANRRLTRENVIRRGLTERQADLFVQTRAAIDKSLTDLAVSQVATLVRRVEGFPKWVIGAAKANPDQAQTIYASAIERATRFVEARLAQERKQLEDANKLFGPAKDHAVLLANNAIAKSEAELKTLAGLDKSIAKVFEKLAQLKNDGYAPLMRFGKYGVTVTGSNLEGDPETIYFGMFDTEGAAVHAEKALRELYPDAEVSRSPMSQEGWQLFQGTDPEVMAMFADALGMGQDAAWQEYYRQAVSNRSALRRLIHRKGTPGFDMDLQRVLAQFLTSNARMASRNYHYGKMLDAAAAIRETGKGDVLDEATKLVKYVQNPIEEASALRGFLFVNFLGGSVAAALVNMTQPVMMTVPYLSQAVGPVRAAAAVAAAMKAAVSGQPTGELGKALKLAEREGVVAPHEIYQLYGQATRNMMGSGAWAKFTKVWGALFSLAEAFNRRTTFIAAFELAEGSTKQRFDKAVIAVEDTQGIYNRANRPNWARGAVGATIFTFKQFSIAYAEFLIRLPTREKALALALLVLAAGLQGLPFAEDLEDIIDTVGQSMGWNTNSKRWVREKAAQVLGETAGGLLTHGISSVLPLDVHARMGLGNMIPGTALLKRSTADKGRELAQFIGPAGSLAQSAGAAYQAISGGNIAGAAEAIAPKAIKDALKASEMMALGYYTDARGRRIVDVTAADAAIKAIGFQPSRVANVQRKSMEVQAEIGLARITEDEIASMWARGIVDKEPDRVREARERLRDWNRRNPRTPIAINSGQINRRVRELRSEKAGRIIKAAPKELRPMAREAME